MIQTLESGLEIVNRGDFSREIIETGYRPLADQECERFRSFGSLALLPVPEELAETDPEAEKPLVVAAWTWHGRPAIVADRRLITGAFVAQKPDVIEVMGLDRVEELLPETLPFEVVAVTHRSLRAIAENQHYVGVNTKQLVGMMERQLGAGPSDVDRAEVLLVHGQETIQQIFPLREVATTREDSDIFLRVPTF